MLDSLLISPRVEDHCFVVELAEVEIGVIDVFGGGDPFLFIAGESARGDLLIVRRRSKNGIGRA